MVDDTRNHLVQLFFQHVQWGGSQFLAIHFSLFTSLGLWQGALVHLLILVQRNSVDLHRHSRNHIRRLLVEDEVVERLDIDVRVADNISSDELAAIFVVESLYGSVLDARELADDSLHLFQLDAEATNLHLSVFTTHKLDVAIGQVTYDITSAISANIFLLVGEGILNEYLCVLIRSVQVAECHLRPGCPQLAQSAHRQTASLLVDHIKFHVVQRFADGHVRILLGDGIDSNDNGGLCGSIAVVQMIASWWGDTCQLLTSHRHVDQGVILNVCRKLITHLCRHEGVGDVLTLQIIVKRHKIQSQFLRDDMYGGTTRQWRIDALLMYVEAIAGVFGHVVLWFQSIVFPIPVAVANQVAMGQLAALGNACRSAGIE